MKLYVLVRGDLSRSQQAVQAGHAVAEFLLEHPSTEWNNGILVYLKVRNKEHLHEWFDKILESGEPLAWFKEEDIGNEVTAIAALDVEKLVRDLPLL